MENVGHVFIINNLACCQRIYSRACAEDTILYGNWKLGPTQLLGRRPRYDFGHSTFFLQIGKYYSRLIVLIKSPQAMSNCSFHMPNAGSRLLQTDMLDARETKQGFESRTQQLVITEKVTK